MSKVKGKGTSLKISVAAVFTAIAAITDYKLPKFKPETAETDDNDNATSAILKECTGRVECGSLTGNMFLDPALSIHKTLIGLLATPATQSYQLIFADTAHTTWPFSGAPARALGGTIDLKDFVKADFEIELFALPTFPT